MERYLSTGASRGMCVRGGDVWLRRGDVWLRRGGMCVRGGHVFACFIIQIPVIFFRLYMLLNDIETPPLFSFLMYSCVLT